MSSYLAYRYQRSTGDQTVPDSLMDSLNYSVMEMSRRIKVYQDELQAHPSGGRRAKWARERGRRGVFCVGVCVWGVGGGGGGGQVSGSVLKSASLDSAQRLCRA